MKAKIISNSCVKGPYYKFILKPLSPVKSVSGQFLMIRPGTSYSPSDSLLPRPFSIHQATADGHIEVLYKRVGKGTAILASLSVGEELEILGPLGNGFFLDGINSAEEVLVVAGGIGVAPMLGLVETLRAGYPEKEIRVFLGGRGEVDLLCVKELKAVSTEVILATNDGTMGFKGYVTEALEKYLSHAFLTPHSSLRTPIIYACGPSPMLQRISEITEPLRIESYFSLEANMACGIGLCMGCAISRRDRKGYYLVCTDGPVFRGESVDLSGKPPL